MTRSLVFLATVLSLGLGGLMGSPTLVEAQNNPSVVILPTTGTSQGLRTSYTASTASSNATLVKATAGNIYHISAVNVTATVYYLKLYNLTTNSGSPCASSSGFVETIPIPASTAGAGIQRATIQGQGFSTGIVFCITGGPGQTDNTSAATGVHVAVLYR